MANWSTDQASPQLGSVPTARWASPPLTTVRQPLEEMGGLAARAILSLARRKALESPQMELTTRLVE